MKTDFSGRSKAFLRLGAFLFLSSLLLAGCASRPVEPAPVRVEEPPAEVSALVYYHGLSKMNAAELNRERMVLTALPPSPATQIRMAMLLGQTRASQDLGRALNLLESVLKSTEPSAVNLNFLAKILIDNYTERQKLELAIDRQGAQLKENQRRISELQEKLDGLADIERTLPTRRGLVKGSATGGAK